MIGRERFTSKERDSETGLDYFGARYFSSAQGRFTSPDEFKGGAVDPFTGQQVSQPGPLPYADITNPQSLNKYAYVLNNPLRYTDPDGHCVEDFCIGEAILFGALGGGVGGAIVQKVSAGQVGPRPLFPFRSKWLPSAVLAWWVALRSEPLVPGVWMRRRRIREIWLGTS